MDERVNDVEADIVRDHEIFQCLIRGIPPYDVALHFGVPLEYVLPIRDELPEFMRKRSTPPSLRKELALARTDMAMRSLMPAVEKGDHDAIDLMLKVQKREAALVGLDAPVKSEADMRIVIDAPWMNPDRLSYQRQEIVDVPAVENQPEDWREKQPRPGPVLIPKDEEAKRLLNGPTPE